MVNLFLAKDEQLYPKQVASIVAMVADYFHARKGYTSYSSYGKACKFVLDVYNGRKFPFYFFNDYHKQFNTVGVQDALSNCKGSYQKIHSLICSCLSHYEASKDQRYLPYNKKYLQKISFSTFWETFNSEANEYPVIQFVNFPKSSSTYYQEKLIDKYKTQLSELNFVNTERYAEDFSKRWKDVQSQYNYWENVMSMCMWWKNMRSTFSEIAAELKAQFSSGQLLIDYTKWLCGELEKKEGGRFSVLPQYFCIGSRETGCLRGWFASYVKTRLIKLCSSLKELPYSIATYYTDDSFQRGKIVLKDKPPVADEGCWNVMGYCELAPGEGHYATLGDFINEYAGRIGEREIELLHNMSKFAPQSPTYEQICERVASVQSCNSII